MNNDLTFIFARNLKIKRRQARLTLEEFSFKSGVGRNYLSELELGKRNPTLKIIGKIALALECKPHELLMENPYIYYKFEENNAK